MAIEPAAEPNQLSALLVERINSRDLAGLVALYEDDAILDTSNGPVVGSAAIREFWSEFLATAPQVSLGQQAEPLVNGDLAFTSTRVPGAFVTAEVARRQPDGSWKWAIDQPSLRVTD